MNTSSTLPSSSRNAPAGHQYHDTQYQATSTAAQDQLAYGMQNSHLNETSYRSNGADSRHVAATAANPSHYTNSYPSQDQQQSTGYPNYFSPAAASQFVAPDSYVDYTDPLTYFRAGVANGSQVVGEARTRDSMYAVPLSCLALSFEFIMSGSTIYGSAVALIGRCRVSA